MTPKTPTQTCTERTKQCLKRLENIPFAANFTATVQPDSFCQPDSFDPNRFRLFDHLDSHRHLFALERHPPQSEPYTPAALQTPATRTASARGTAAARATGSHGIPRKLPFCEKFESAGACPVTTVLRLAPACQGSPCLRTKKNTVRENAKYFSPP